jgi:hypothetical protein
VIKYEQLYYLDLTSLGKAVEAWENAVRQLKGLESEMAERVEKPFKSAGWSSSDFSSATAERLLADTARELSDAGAEARGIHTALEQARDDLKECKAALHRIAETEAKAEGLFVSGTGDVKPRHDLSQDAGATHDPDGREAISEQDAKCEALAGRLDRVLKRAEQVDARASWALKNNSGTNRNDFNPSVVKEIDDADKYMKSEKRFTDAESYIFTEMQTNIKSDSVKNIQALLRPPEWYEFGRNYGSDTTAALTI